MIIKELIISAFGRFKNKKILLNDGLNIIYGENEAGKTTIHKFIKGIFYGFFSPYTKIRRYTDDYYKYIPWEDSKYSGILKYEFNGKTYRIERNFLKGEDEVKFIDDKDGTELTKLLQYDSTTRLYEPSSMHIGINSIVFDNTVSIKQLGSKTDDDLIKEVKDSLANLGGALDEDISVKKIIEKLNKKIRNIGTKKRVKTSPYGKIVKEIEDLKIERKQLIDRMKAAKQYQEELNYLREEYESLEYTKQKLQSELEFIQLYKIKKQYHEAKKIINENETIHKKLEGLDRYKNIDIDDYNSLIILQNEIDTLEKSLYRLEERIKDTNNKIKKTQFKIEDIKTIIANDKVYENDKQDKYSWLSKKLQKRTKTNKIYMTFLILLTITMIVSLFFGVIMGRKFFVLSIFSTISLIILFFMNIKNNKKIMYTKNEMNTLRQKTMRIKNEKELQLSRYKEDIKELYNEIEILENRKSNSKRNIDHILKRNNVKSIDDFKKGKRKKKEYNRLIQIIKYNRSLLEKVLDGKSYNALENEVEELSDSDVEFINIKKSNEEEIKKELNETTDLLINVSKKKSSLEEKINNLISRERSIADINDDIIRKEKNRNEYELKLKSLKLARNTIDKISKNIQKDFAPKLNKAVGGTIKSITDDKYSNVKITEDIHIKVEEPYNNNLIDIDNLSYGTIDQFYFAFRLAIIDIIKQDLNLPLILDDCFVQYDNRRLLNVLDFLSEQSSSRQILLFTCQNREKELLDELGVDFNTIDLIS